MWEIPSVIKVFGIFTFIVMLNRFKLDLGISIIIGTFLLGLSFKMKALSTLFAMLKSLGEPMTLMLIALVSLILFLNQLMEQRGTSRRMVESFACMVKNIKVSMVALPALIGLLPMPGGAYFSAPMIGQLTKETNLTPDQKTLVNYWFRHIWEFWWPMYPGVIMALSISGLLPGVYIPMQIIFTIIALVLGYFLILRRLPHHIPAPSVNQNVFQKNLIVFLNNAMPIFIILFFMFLLSFTESIWTKGLFKNNEMIKYLPMFIGLGLSIIFLIIRDKFNLKEVSQAIFNKKILTLILLVIGIMAYKKILALCGAIDKMNIEFQSFNIPLLPVVILLPFISGMVPRSGTWICRCLISFGSKPCKR